MELTPLQRAVAAEPFNGNQSRFAEAIGTSQQNISNWLRRGAKLPAELVLQAARVTGIPPHVWRPEVFEGVSNSTASLPGPTSEVT